MEGIDWSDLAQDPLQQFASWFRDAERAQIPLHDAMTLATATPHGRPSGRIVLLKRLDERGFVFTTNGASRKGDELRANPHGCLVFHWPLLERQVRVEGPVETAGETLSDELFAERPRESQLGAWASDQSRVIDNRDALLARLAQVRERFAGAVPRPPRWGAFRLIPESVEFWHKRDFRLHDRLRFQRDAGGSWRRERLSP